MQCPKCGWKNADYAAKCANCFVELKPVVPLQPAATQQMPPQVPQQTQVQQPYAQPLQQQYTGPQYQSAPAVTIPDFMIWSIVVTVVSVLLGGLISVVLGIIAIVRSSQASNKKNMGDYIGAIQDSGAAKTWVWWAIGVDVAWILLLIACWSLIIAVIMSAPRGSGAI